MLFERSWLHKCVSRINECLLLISLWVNIIKIKNAKQFQSHPLEAILANPCRDLWHYLFSSLPQRHISWGHPHLNVEPIKNSAFGIYYAAFYDDTVSKPLLSSTDKWDYSFTALIWHHFEYLSRMNQSYNRCMQLKQAWNFNSTLLCVVRLSLLYYTLPRFALQCRYNDIWDLYSNLLQIRLTRKIKIN